MARERVSALLSGRIRENSMLNAARDGVDRATRLLGASKPASRSTTVVLDPFVASQLLGIIGSTLSGDRWCGGGAFR